MLHSQMHIKAAQTKRSAASTNSESKLKTVLQTCSTSDYSWLLLYKLHHNHCEFYDSTSNLTFSPPFIKSPGRVTCFSADSTRVWRFESFECFKLSCRWHRELVRHSQDHSVHHVLENNLFTVLGNSLRPFAQFQSSCSNQFPPPQKITKNKKTLYLSESHGSSLRGRNIQKFVFIRKKYKKNK